MFAFIADRRQWSIQDKDSASENTCTLAYCSWWLYRRKALPSRYTPYKAVLLYLPTAYIFCLKWTRVKRATDWRRKYCIMSNFVLIKRFVYRSNAIQWSWIKEPAQCKYRVLEVELLVLEGAWTDGCTFLYKVLIVIVISTASCWFQTALDCSISTPSKPRYSQLRGFDHHAACASLQLS